MNIQHHIPENLFTPIGPYSHFSQAGNFIQISGTPSVDPKTGSMVGEDAYSQTKQILFNFQTMLQSANASLSNILHIHVF